MSPNLRTVSYICETPDIQSYEDLAVTRIVVISKFVDTGCPTKFFAFLSGMPLAFQVQRGTSKKDRLYTPSGIVTEVHAMYDPENSQWRKIIHPFRKPDSIDDIEQIIKQILSIARPKQITSPQHAGIPYKARRGTSLMQFYTKCILRNQDS
jgi:hypothetical protein